MLLCAPGSRPYIGRQPGDPLTPAPATWMDRFPTRTNLTQRALAPDDVQDLSCIRVHPHFEFVHASSYIN